MSKEKVKKVYPEFVTDTETILKEAFGKSKRLESQARAVLACIKTDGPKFLDDHVHPHARETTLRAIGITYEYHDAENHYDMDAAWIFPFVGNYDGQCKNPLYVDKEDNKLHVTTSSRGAMIICDNVRLSKKMGLYDWDKDRIKGLIVQKKCSWFRRSEDHHEMNLILPASEIVEMFEKCLPTLQ